MKHAEYREQVINRQIELMHERGIWAKPDSGRPTKAKASAVNHQSSANKKRARRLA
jgi:hypothetical protein